MNSRCFASGAAAAASGTHLSVSIALCTYNGERYLREQLDSFLKQTILPDELVVCDDLSSDRTLEIVDAFSREAPFPVRCFVNALNMGSTRNFERAIGLCSGDVIFLSDQDDVWRSDKIELMCREFARRPEICVVFSDAEVVEANLLPMGYRLWASMEFSRVQQRRLLSGRAFEVLLKHNVVTGAAMAFRKELRAEFFPISEHWIHDGWISIVAAIIGKIGCVDEPLILYRQHGRNQVGGVRKSLGDEMAHSQRVGTEQYAQQTLQYGAVLSWLEGRADISKRSEFQEGLSAKIAHLRHRSELPGLWAERFVSVSKELLAGRYFRFSRGMKSCLKDLFRSCPRSPLT